MFQRSVTLCRSRGSCPRHTAAGARIIGAFPASSPAQTSIIPSLRWRRSFAQFDPSNDSKKPKLDNDKDNVATESKAKQSPPSPPHVNSLPPVPANEPPFWFSGAGMLLSLGGISALNHFVFDGAESTMMLAGFGASSVLIFAVPGGPLSQPRNVLIGHSLATMCGVNANMFLTVPMESAIIAGPLAATATFLLMKQANALHPPAGGTALALAMDQGKLAAMGFEVIVPTLWGSSLLIAAGYVLHNLRCRGSYPTKWF